MDTSNRLARVTQAIFVAQRERALSSVDAVLEPYRSRRFLVSFPSAWIIALGQGHLAECHPRVGEPHPSPSSRRIFRLSSQYARAAG